MRDHVSVSPLRSGDSVNRGGHGTSDVDLGSDEGMGSEDEWAAIGNRAMPNIQGKKKRNSSRRRGRRCMACRRVCHKRCWIPTTLASALFLGCLIFMLYVLLFRGLYIHVASISVNKIPTAKSPIFGFSIQVSVENWNVRQVRVSDATFLPYLVDPLSSLLYPLTNLTGSHNSMAWDVNGQSSCLQNITLSADLTGVTEALSLLKRGKYAVMVESSILYRLDPLPTLEESGSTTQPFYGCFSQ